MIKAVEHLAPWVIPRVTFLEADLSSFKHGLNEASPAPLTSDLGSASRTTDGTQMQQGANDADLWTTVASASHQVSSSTAFLGLRTRFYLHALLIKFVVLTLPAAWPGGSGRGGSPCMWSAYRCLPRCGHPPASTRCRDALLLQVCSNHIPPS